MGGEGCSCNMGSAFISILPLVYGPPKDLTPSKKPKNLNPKLGCHQMDSFYGHALPAA